MNQTQAKVILLSVLIALSGIVYFEWESQKFKTICSVSKDFTKCSEVFGR